MSKSAHSQTLTENLPKSFTIIKSLMKQSKPTRKSAQKVMPSKVEPENPDMQTVLSVMEKLLHWGAIIDSSDDAIISKSVDGYITSWNKGAQRLYGYTPEEVIGKPVSILMPPEKENDFPYIMNQLHAGNRVEHYETKRKTKDGRIIDVSLTVSPIKDRQGNIIGASKIARDITELKDLERRREEFISVASHELKTPITSQKAFGELLEKLIDKNGDTHYKPYIHKINIQTAKLTKLIEDLLELSRVQTGRFELHKSKFNLDSLVSETVKDAQMISKHTLLVSGKTDKMITADRERVGQVILNLILNATKYSPKSNTVNIKITSDKHQVKLSVTDSGIGIDKKYHEKIFERFFRVDGHEEKTFPGMGIGLFVCKEIIVRHGGKIWVESQKGNGSTFSFSLPLSKN